MRKMIAIGSMLFLLACSMPAIAQEHITVGASTTVNLTSGVIDLGCADLEIQADGTFQMSGGTIQNLGQLIVRQRAVYTKTGGLIVYCPVFIPALPLLLLGG